jgi:hypothetical protein
MSGLLVRFGEPLAKMVFRDASSKHASDLTGQWVPRIVSHLGSIDPSISPSAAPAQPIGDLADRLIS